MQINVTNAECSPTPVPLPPPPVQPCVGGGTVPDPALLPHVLPANTPKGTRQRPRPNLQSEGLGDPPQPGFKWRDLCGTSMPPTVSCIPRISIFLGGGRGEAATLRFFLRKAYPVPDQLFLPVIRVRSMRVHEVRVANTRKFFSPQISVHRCQSALFYAPLKPLPAIRVQSLDRNACAGERTVGRDRWKTRVAVPAPSLIRRAGFPTQTPIRDCGLRYRCPSRGRLRGSAPFCIFPCPVFPLFYAFVRRRMPADQPVPQVADPHVDACVGIGKRLLPPTGSWAA